MPRKQHGAKFFVGDHGCVSIGSAITYAQGLAERWPDDEERSFYIRDALDNALYRVDREAGGVVLTYPLI